MTSRLRVVQGRRGVPTTVVVRQTELDDLLDELMALTTEAIELADKALPLAHQLSLMAQALGPRSAAVAHELIDLLERVQHRHSPRKAA